MTSETNFPYSIDASVAVKWFIEEEAFEAARAVLIQGRVLIAPDLILPEVASALASKARAGDFRANDIPAALAELEQILDIVPTRLLIEPALTLSMRFGTTLFDCIYLTLALQEDGLLVTADRRFRNGMSPLYDDSIVLVEEPPPV